MGIISDVIETVGGSWLKVAALPVAFTAAIVGWHQLVKTREALQQERETRLVERGRKQCISEVELATARAERDAFQRREAAARDEAAAAAQASEEIRANAERIQVEMDQIRADAGRLDPDLCLSPGVRQLLRGVGADQGQKRQ